MKKIILTITALLLPFVAFGAVFTDDDTIPEWAKPAIYELTNQGIVTGNNDGTVAPLEAINRGEFATLMVRVTDVPLTEYVPGSFADINGDEWYAPYAATAKAQGWLSGYPDGTFRAGDKVNRAEVAKILWNATEFPHTREAVTDAPWFDIYFYELADSNLLAYGTDFSTAEPAVYPTRAEVMEQLFRFMVMTGRYSPTQDIEDVSGVLEGEIMEINIPEDAVIIPDTSGIEQYKYEEENPVTSINKDPRAGQLQVSLSETMEKSRFLTRGQEYPLHELMFATPKNTELVKVSALRFRLLSGRLENFDTLWLEVDGETFSGKIIPIGDTENMIEITLDSPIVITKQRPRTITLKGEVAMDAQPMDGRFVLYMPQWIGTDSSEVVALFPLAGTTLKLVE